MHIGEQLKSIHEMINVTEVPENTSREKLGGPKEGGNSPLFGSSFFFLALRSQAPFPQLSGCLDGQGLRVNQESALGHPPDSFAPTSPCPSLASLWKEFELSRLPPKEDLVPSSREGTERLQTPPNPQGLRGLGDSEPSVQHATDQAGPARPPGMERILEGRGLVDLGVGSTRNFQPTLGAKTLREKQPLSRADLGATLTPRAPAENLETESGLSFPPRTRQRRRRGAS